MLFNHIVPALLLSAAVSASPVNDTPRRRQINLVDAYAPDSFAACPSSALIRPASGINPDEATWVAARKKKATTSLVQWLGTTGTLFPTLAADQYPTLALVDGGGGFRGFLIAAGVRKAFDSREGHAYSTSGLYQAMTYETGLSGSSASLGSYAYNNWATVSTLAAELWSPRLASGILFPDSGNPEALLKITADVASKAASGYEVGVVDAWGRILSYVSLLEPDAGVAQHYSDIPTYSEYAAHNVPLPIMTSIGILDAADGCGLPALSSPQFEFTPYEFGSWEAGIQNFMQVKYIGTAMDNGNSITGLFCTTGFDNAGWIIGTSTNTFNQDCAPVRNTINGIFTEAILSFLSDLLKDIAGFANTPLYSLMPNPFQGLTSAPSVSNMTDLILVDGGETLQVPPIWPLLYRDVDVIFVSDNSADNPDNYSPRDAYTFLPGGRQVYHTYQQAQINGIADRLPVIPPQTTFERENLNKKTVFFGCNLDDTSDALRIVYLPNRIISFNSSLNSNQLTYTTAQTAGMIANGIEVATDAGADGFGTCLACLVMKKVVAKAGKTLPSACAACFTKYCYN